MVQRILHGLNITRLNITRLIIIRLIIIRPKWSKLLTEPYKNSRLSDHIRWKRINPFSFPGNSIKVTIP